MKEKSHKKEPDAEPDAGAEAVHAVHADDGEDKQEESSQSITAQSTHTATNGTSDQTTDTTANIPWYIRVAKADRDNRNAQLDQDLLQIRESMRTTYNNEVNKAYAMQWPCPCNRPRTKCGAT